MNGHEGWFPWGIGMWLFWILLTVVVIWLVRSLAGGGEGGTPPTRESALEILRQRYARGEISEEEFERRRKKLLEE